MKPSYPKRLIEVDLPIKRISAHARREKSIRHGHISTLHIWWARRPLAACRAVILAALWPDPADENCPESFLRAAREWMLRWARENARKASGESFQRLVRAQKDERVLDDALELRRCLLDFIADFANWDNSTDPAYLETSRALVQAAHESLGGARGTRPLVVDPFAGGGAIPLEALRVGADAFASDLNPVAVLLNKVVLEYIPKHGRRLADEVRKWGQWIKNEAEKELAEFYPKDPDGATPIAYLWARTVRCEGPGCGFTIPLIRNTQLTRTSGGWHFLLQPDAEGRAFKVSVRQGITATRGSTVSGGAAVCPRCAYTTRSGAVREQLVAQRGGARTAQLLAIGVETDHGRRFRDVTPHDFLALEVAHAAIERIHLPDEVINPIRPYKNTRGVSAVTRIGIRTFGDLYTARQAISLRAFWAALMRREETPWTPGARTAVLSCLACATARFVFQNCSLSRWHATRDTIEGAFGKQALQNTWDFAEANPVANGPASWDGAVEWVAKVVEANAIVEHSAVVRRARAQDQPLPDESADAIVTDPPYFASIPYADLSDVFYVFERDFLRRHHADLFTGSLTEKDSEIIVTDANPARGGDRKTPSFYEREMTSALGAARSTLRAAGIGVVVFADARTESWEAILGALISAGWSVTGSWPIDTELQTRTQAAGAASLQSSVHVVCRPRESADGFRADAVGDWRDVLAELPKRIHEWMPRLANEGVIGADAIFACLGPALEIFSRYSRVEKASGEEVKLKEYLEHVWAAVAREALSMIFAGAETSGFEEDARLTAMWLWTLSKAGGGKADASTDDSGVEDNEEEDEPEHASGASSTKTKMAGYALEYDAARKIAQGLGAHLEDLTTTVEVKGETARLLPVAERTRHLFGRAEAEAPSAKRKRKDRQMKLGFAAELDEAEETAGWGDKGVPPSGATVLDRVHQSMILFAAGRGEALRRFLVDEGAGRDARFWRLAQALAALYPAGSDERRWVEGVQARKKGLGL